MFLCANFLGSLHGKIFLLFFLIYIGPGAEQSSLKNTPYIIFDWGIYMRLGWITLVGVIWSFGFILTFSPGFSLFFKRLLLRIAISECRS